MLLIRCPYCEMERPELEFAYAGEAHIARPADPSTLSDEEWRDFLFTRSNPRGILSAGSEEPNALMGVSRGAGRFEPNTRATALELYDGLKAESQNHWPSLKHDVGAINDAFSMFFSAGFYYKTFMWPKSFWNKVYEPFIRRGRSWQIAIRTRSRHLCQPLCLLRCACRGGGASRACGSA
ncbi:sarcosine oxidase subunit delta [Brucella abortus]|nr:sarcosine oxidase subunit delta [Brucella abortus]MBI1636236.1 sarcosine oxidase subunit delta [Brucella abortus]